MRILRAISDLPWWSGLPIFLIGNLMVPHGMFGYMVGLCICMFGCWIFSKLVKRDEYATGGGSAIVGIPLFGLLLYFVTDNYDHYIIDLHRDTLYVIRACGGMFIGFIAFSGFVK